MSITQNGVILEGVLRRFKRKKIFKTKWEDRYFVLYCRDRDRKLYAIDEYKSNKKKDVKKTYKLEMVTDVESNLCLADSSLSCSASSDIIKWIFSINFRPQSLQKDIFLSAGNDEEMKLWVREICKICGLRSHTPFHDYSAPREIDVSRIASSSVVGMSDSSESLDTSIIDHSSIYGNDMRNAPDTKPYLRMQNFTSVSSNPGSVNYSNLAPEPVESGSETSSVWSSRKTEEDSTSSISGPPIPPPRIRPPKFFNKNIPANRLNAMAATSSMNAILTVNENDSSGETLKMDHAPPSMAPSYPESVTSSEGYMYEGRDRNPRSLIRRPPPVDRSNKPKNMRDDSRYRNLNEKQITITRTTDRPVKRQNLEYFEPMTDPLRIGGKPPSSAVTNTRSPTPSDIEYISVDVDRTMAFKQMRRAHPTMD